MEEKDTAASGEQCTDGTNEGKGKECPEEGSGDAQPEETKANVVKSEAPHEKGEGWSTGNIVILCVIVSFLCSALSLYFYDKMYAQKIVAIDIKGYIDEQRNLFVEGKLSPEDLKKKIDLLEATVMKVPKNKAIVMGDAVVRNVEVIKP